MSHTVDRLAYHGATPLGQNHRTTSARQPSNRAQWTAVTQRATRYFETYQPAHQKGIRIRRVRSDNSRLAYAPAPNLSPLMLKLHLQRELELYAMHQSREFQRTWQDKILPLLTTVSWVGLALLISYLTRGQILRFMPSLGTTPGKLMFVGGVGSTIGQTAAIAIYEGRQPTLIEVLTAFGGGAIATRFKLIILKLFKTSFK